PRPQTLVTDVGVRLPAQLTASGRAMLAHLAESHVRALFPTASSFVSRTDRGPRTPTALRHLLRMERRRAWAVEGGFGTDDFASVAHAVRDRGGRPIAAASGRCRHDGAARGRGSAGRARGPGVR